MDFHHLYEKLHSFKVNCHITENIQVHAISFGHGGSQNVIIRATIAQSSLSRSNNNSQNKYFFVIKVIPNPIYYNVEIKPDYAQLEIKIYQFFTKKYLLTDRSPHFVGLYNHQTCPKLDRFLESIYRRKLRCQSLNNKLLMKIDEIDEEDRLCSIILQQQLKLIDPQFDIMVLEHCPIQLSRIILVSMDDISKYKDKRVFQRLDIFYADLYRILFQLIFTLSIVKEDYPGFIHGDFFVRNILSIYEASYKENEMVAYHYKQKIFYLSANGFYAKISDFGQTIIANELEPNTYHFDKIGHKYYHINPFNAKNDIFNLLRDIYDGQNLGTLSIKKLVQEFKIPGQIERDIVKFMSLFIDTRTIDKISAINKNLLDSTWYIDQVDLLEESVMTPHEYLMSDVFNLFQQLPEDAIVIKHFNKPK